MTDVDTVVPAEASGVGSSFDDFLQEEGIYEEVSMTAIKRTVAWQIKAEMKKKKITKSVMAERMRTSRKQLDRLLQEDDDSNVTLMTLARAAHVVGRKLEISLS
jgi:DNA-binding Xre family transcriptional regulator